MKKIPRDINGFGLIKILGRHYQHKVTRQSGSHIRLTSFINGEHHITTPNHDSIRIGTLSSILSDIALYLGKSKEEIVDELF